MSTEKLIYNGKLMNANAAFISPNNRSFRYGDGFFETMKMVNGKILLCNEHLERLFTSLELLAFEKPIHFTAPYLQNEIESLAKKNYHNKLARIRLTVFRGEGGLYDVANNFPNYIIQTWELNPANNTFNENGLVIDIFKDARKAYDAFSAIKSNNYLCYTMAALWAKKNKLNDALLLNSFDRVADATIANVFIVQDGIIKTPAITEAGVNGIMKRYLIKCMKNEAMPVQETQITVDEILQAQEVFFTNSIYGIKWVKQCSSSNYITQLAPLLHKKFVAPLVL